VIVVDNGSTDKTLKILQKFSKKIRILREPIKGSYRARNLGIKYAKGKFILFTDSDCIAKKNWIEKIIIHFNNPKTKIVGGPIKAVNENKFPSKYFSMLMHNQEYFYKSKKFATSNMAIRKKELNKVSLFDEELESGADFYLCSKIVKKSFDIEYEPDALIYHNYPNSLFFFIKKMLFYGKWHSIIARKYNKKFKIKYQSNLEMIKIHGLLSVILNLLGWAVFKSRYYVGFLLKE
jgi:glycosyltransferase involved in cell wall biosynthesis